MSFYFSVCLMAPVIFCFISFLYCFEGLWELLKKKEEVVLCQKCVWISYDLLGANTI